MLHPIVRHVPRLFSALAVVALLSSTTGCEDDKSAGDESAEAPKKKKKGADKGAKKPAASASASANVPAVSKPSDPFLASLVGPPSADAGLDTSVTLKKLGVAWSVPKLWKTMDFSDATGGAAKVRKKSHSMDNKTSIDVMAMSADQVKRLAGGKPFPEVGDKPYGGKNGSDKWSSFEKMKFGRSNLDAVVTYGFIKKIGIAYITVKGDDGKVFQVSANWRKGDDKSKSLAAQVVQSLGKVE